MIPEVEEQRRESPSGWHFYSLYWECPRRHYFKYGCGLQPIKTPKALIFGGCMHEAIAFYYEHWGLEPDNLIEATIECFREETIKRVAEYERSDEYEADLVRGPLLLKKWHDTWYKNDKKKYRIVEVEKGYTLPVGPNDEFILTVRPDRVFEEKLSKRKVVPDVKTTGYSIDAPFKTADAQDQMTSYLWALKKAHPKWDVGEAFIDVLFIRKSQSKDPNKLFTEPKAERPGIIYRSQEALAQFEMGLFGTILEVSQKYENVGDEWPAEVLFPRNGKDCSMFGCDFADICRKKIDKAFLPDGFKRDPWLEDCVKSKLQGVKK